MGTHTQAQAHPNPQTHRPAKDRTNLDFHSNRISNRISSKFGIRIEYRIEYEYSVASKSIRILNGVEMSCRDAASSCGHGHRDRMHRSFCLLSDLTIKTTVSC